ncbi:MAG: putative transporter [Bacteroidales bacterium]|nr:putative transporter [Bacteroidales bacterium]
MNWFNELIFGTGIGHSVMLLSICIVCGILLGRIKIFGISLGITFVLFVGILMGHFGITMDTEVMHFMKEFGLILFVFSIGMQVGPGFFSSFKQGGITLNLLASGVVLLGVLITIAIHFITNIPMETMVGILSGAVTNTPGLGAAQTAFSDMTGSTDNTIALGYAVCYPLGVVGIILAIICVRYIFRVNFNKEKNELEALDQSTANQANLFSLEVQNPAIFGHTVAEVAKLLIHSELVISRVLHTDGTMEIASSNTVLNKGDKVFIVTVNSDIEIISAVIGCTISMKPEEWYKLDKSLISRRIIVTKSELNGKRLGELNLRKQYHINISRINRSGIDLVARPNLILQLGDRLTVVGGEEDVKKVEEILGNSMKRLNEPNLVTLFLGIFLGVFAGSIPIMFPGIPQPVKLGLAGGPLIVAILISRFGYKYKLITYNTISSNLMLREIGITIFLACVGIGAGNGFVDTIIYKGGLQWMLYGFIISFLPLLIIGIVGRVFFKINYFTLMGLLSGSTTDPPALAYSNATAGNDAPAVSYATVYPLTMFLRVLSAQLLILLFC